MAAVPDDLLVAYFSLEFGVDERLPVYAGGLGVLAGDHLKSADELGLPLVGVGLFYRQGYFGQEVDGAGEQVERYPEQDPAALRLVLEPVTVTVNLAGEAVEARVWRKDVGRVRLYLLDAPGITDVLYGGDREHRIRQEILLGVGGVRALAALGLRPTVFHLNEGHSAFLVLERVRELLERGVSFEEALARVRLATVFTTHTPVPAGNERFDVELARRYLRPLGVPVDEVLALGAASPADPVFGMTPLALRVSGRANAVSQLHGLVSRQMWAPLWPGRDPKDVPIGHVTNGVHGRTWQAEELRGRTPAAAELWRIHRSRKERLLAYVTEHTGQTLDPDALTVGFARRFAGYKRAWLLFSQPERIARLLGDPDRPVQVLVAGKAHPADGEGKAILASVVRSARASEGRVVFLTGYDITVARLLVQGVDVWVNTPRRGEEASGTSGMKAALNGVPNLSVLDGWWFEAYRPGLGWALSDDSSRLGDAAEADELLRLLEEEVVPAFYERDGDGLPQRWLGMMQRTLAELAPRFESGRMVRDYLERYYLPAHAAATRSVEPAPVTGR